MERSAHPKKGKTEDEDENDDEDDGCRLYERPAKRRLVNLSGWIAYRPARRQTTLTRSPVPPFLLRVPCSRFPVPPL
jgi:hypothetical protein